MTDICAIQEDLTLQRIVKALEKLDRSRFAGTRGTHESNSGARLDIEAQVFEDSDIRSCWVLEHNIAKLDATNHLSRDDTILRVRIDRGNAIDGLEDLVCNGACRRDMLVMRRQSEERDRAKDDDEESTHYAESCHRSVSNKLTSIVESDTKDAAEHKEKPAGTNTNKDSTTNTVVARRSQLEVVHS